MGDDRRKILLGAALLVLSGVLLLGTEGADSPFPIGLVTLGAIGGIAGSDRLGRAVDRFR